MIAITVGYALSPIDIIPDFIPILGYLDDLIILPLMIALSIRLIPTDVLNAYRQRVTESDQLNGKSGTIAAALIVLFWLVLLGMVISQVAI